MFEILLSNGFPSHNIPPNAYRQLRLGILSTTKPDLFKPQPSVRRDKSDPKMILAVVRVRIKYISTRMDFPPHDLKSNNWKPAMQVTRALHIYNLCSLTSNSSMSQLAP